jgi:hypothetical protein
MLESEGYLTCIATIREKVDHVTGLIAYKKDEFELVHSHQIDFTDLIKVYEECRFSTGLICLIKHIKTG